MIVFATLVALSPSGNTHEDVHQKLIKAPHAFDMCTWKNKVITSNLNKYLINFANNALVDFCELDGLSALPM